MKPKCNLTLEAKNLPQLFVTEPIKCTKSFNFFKNPLSSKAQKTQAQNYSEKSLKGLIQGLAQNPKAMNEGLQLQDFSGRFMEEEKENNMLLSNISEIPAHELHGNMVGQGRYEQRGAFLEEKHGYNIREYRHMRNRLQSSLSRSKSKELCEI